MTTYKHLSFLSLDIFSCKPEKWKEKKYTLYNTLRGWSLVLPMTYVQERKQWLMWRENRYFLAMFCNILETNKSLTIYRKWRLLKHSDLHITAPFWKKKGKKPKTTNICTNTKITYVWIPITVSVFSMPMHTWHKIHSVHILMHDTTLETSMQSTNQRMCYIRYT